MSSDVRGGFPINSQRLTDPVELPLLYGQFKQKTCLYMHALSAENQFETPTKRLSIVSGPNKFAGKNFIPLQLSFRPPPCHN